MFTRFATVAGALECNVSMYATAHLFDSLEKVRKLATSEHLAHRCTSEKRKKTQRQIKDCSSRTTEGKKSDPGIRQSFRNEETDYE